MPPITDSMVLSATNKALVQLAPPGCELPNLGSTEKSNPAWSCNNFAPEVFANVLKESGGTEPSPINYKKSDLPNWPKSFPDQSFVNFSLYFKQSSSNHNFNVYFQTGKTCVLLQVYLHNSVRISTPQPTATFMELWRQLGTEDWPTAYGTLFGVVPVASDNDLVDQWVTTVTTP